MILMSTNLKDGRKKDGEIIRIDDSLDIQAICVTYPMNTRLCTYVCFAIVPHIDMENDKSTSSGSNLIIHHVLTPATCILQRDKGNEHLEATISGK